VLIELGSSGDLRKIIGLQMMPSSIKKLIRHKIRHISEFSISKFLVTNATRYTISTITFDLMDIHVRLTPPRI
jgi:hypothetical protein